MTFPLDFWNIGLLLAVMAIILLVTSELLLPRARHGKTSILINKKKLKNTALTVSILFLMTVAIRMAILILNL